MPRGRGQIPSYGEHLTLDSAGYDKTLASSVYVSKVDSEWFIRSDKTSKKWRIYRTVQAKYSGNYGRYDPEVATAVSGVFKSLTVAMNYLSSGLELGYYEVSS